MRQQIKRGYIPVSEEYVKNILEDVLIEHEMINVMRKRIKLKE